jgi:hypothetical protein
MITHNAGWNPTTGFWVQDDATIGSSAQTWSNIGFSGGSTSSGQIGFYTVPAASSTFADSAWTCLGNFSRVGLQLPFTSDPNNALTVPNLVNSRNLTVAWANITLSAGSITINDSWNVASAAFLGEEIQVTLYAAVSTNSALVATPTQVTTTPPLLYAAGFNSTTLLSVLGWDHTGTQIDLSSASVRFNITITGPSI